jgi:predicted esterase
MQETLAARHEQLADSAIDLAREKFDVLVPTGPPPYGLVVFIAPWPDATQPRTWRAPLDRHGLVFVSARDSGNDRPVLDRRLPLALLAYENARARYPIDPARVYVWGFSGGSRVAEMAALAYPDVFRGVILNAGADPIDGREGMYKPSAELFRAFQRMRVVMITGDQDLDVQQQDAVAERSLRDACINVASEPFHGGHEALDAVALDRVLDAVEARPAIDEAALARCNARVEQAIAAKLAAVTDRAQAEFGGLAAPGLLELDARLH